ncbi:M56 family metallopeptidase [Thermomonas sp.]|uniref:M56 family metallopeptidase n=1 Tax=Thermomonas sp. TaxID=1971895 RepID=UPI00248906BF|nr:M56 family metallopeptidase [Thermomonas sp.]MDI1252690.1 M56 family metallopeptidase [Thermomonas sp.]
MDVVALLPWRLAPALVTALLHSLWQDTLLALIAVIALDALSQRDAATRHSVAMGVLTAMVLVPFATFLRLLHAPAAAQATGWLPALTPPELDAATGQFVQQSDLVPAVLALLWLCGVGVMLLRRFAGWRLVANLDRHNFSCLPQDWQQRFEVLRDAMGITRRVAVRLSHELVGPFTARLLWPVIWLPLSLLTQLPREQLEALLAHELAHIARLDWLWNGLQCVMESLLFFHPAAWWLGRRIRQEREHACDDRAVAVCGDAIALAEALEQLERQRHIPPQLVLAAQGGSLMKRITRLLAAPPARARWGAAIGTGALVVSGVLLVTQLGLAKQGRQGIHISTTTDGVLGPGDTREISAYAKDGWRHYTVSVGKDGKVTETLEVEGKPTPVTADTQRWIAETLRLNMPPPPPPPPPAPPPSLGALPMPPPPPDIHDLAMFKILMQRVVADQSVMAKLGSPAVLASKDVKGSIEIGNGARPDGDANVTFKLRGPKGQADVHVNAQLTEGEWSMDRVDFESAVR